MAARGSVNVVSLEELIGSRREMIAEMEKEVGALETVVEMMKGEWQTGKGAKGQRGRGKPVAEWQRGKVSLISIWWWIPGITAACMGRSPREWGPGSSAGAAGMTSRWGSIGRSGTGW